jgi:hypothetical protein
VNSIYKAHWISFNIVGWLFMTVEIYFSETKLFPTYHLPELFMGLTMVSIIGGLSFCFLKDDPK